MIFIEKGKERMGCFLMRVQKKVEKEKHKKRLADADALCIICCYYFLLFSSSSFLSLLLSFLCNYQSKPFFLITTLPLACPFIITIPFFSSFRSYSFVSPPRVSH